MTWRERRPNTNPPRLMPGLYAAVLLVMFALGLIVSCQALTQPRGYPSPDPCASPHP